MRNSSNISKLFDKAWIAAALLLGAAVLRFPCDDFGLSMAVLLEIAVCLLVACAMWSINKWWGLLLGLAIISRFFPFYTRYSYLAFQALFYGALWYYFLVSRCDAKAAVRLMDAMCVIAMINILFIILQAFQIMPAAFQESRLFYVLAMGGLHHHPLALVGNQNHAAALVAFCLPAFLRRGWAWALIIAIPGLILTKTSGGMLAVAVGAIVYASFYNLRLGAAAALVAGLAFAGYCRLVDMPSTDRWQAWVAGWEGIKQHWAFGSGLGHWKVVFRQLSVADQWWTAAHNEFLQGLFEMGIAFPVIVIGYLSDIARRIRKDAALPATALAVIVVNSCVNFPFHIGTTAMIAVTWLAILEITLRDGAKEAQKEA